MKILIVDNGTTYLKQLVKLVSPAIPNIKLYSELVEADCDDYDLIILSGGHKHSVVGHASELSKEINLLKNTKSAVLGICFGFELIAYSFGALLKQLPSKSQRIISINRTADDQLFTGISKIEVFESHRWVVEKMPAEIVGLANSIEGIEIIKHKDKPIYGFQFHPEMFPNLSDGDELFANFVKIVQNRGT